MRLETSQAGTDEPQGGWVESVTLTDTEILHLLLCRFTGERAWVERPCLDRVDGLHPDVECKTVFLQAKALKLALSDELMLPGVNDEVRTPYVHGELEAARILPWTP